jgi:hypothetical protein
LVLFATDRGKVADVPFMFCVAKRGNEAVMLDAEVHPGDEARDGTEQEDYERAHRSPPSSLLRRSPAATKST